MARRKKDFPLQKVTLNLYEGEFDRLQELAPELGASHIVRELVHAHILRVESVKAKPPRVDLDLSTLGEASS